MQLWTIVDRIRSLNEIGEDDSTQSFPVKADGLMVAHCHIQICEIAKEAAGHLYERLMRDSRYYEAWRRQNPDAGPQELERRFVEKNWPKCVAVARESLAEMLKRPDVPEAAKAQITEILAKDQSLIRVRG
jgi:hypothetical protein